VDSSSRQPWIQGRRDFEIALSGPVHAEHCYTANPSSDGTIFSEGSWLFGKLGTKSMKLEICVDSVESAIAAARGCAERIELCSALSEGGITPSSGLIAAVRKAVSIEVFVIVRPRGGDFVYSDHEFEVMRDDIRKAKDLGVDGVVLGVLTEEGAVDTVRTRLLVEEARPLGVTFHRAFDVTHDLDRALEDVIASGADRVLTSGGESSATRGMEQLARLCQTAQGRIKIMAGGGIRQSNVRNLVLHTGVCEVHTSLSVKVASPMRQTGLHAKIGAHMAEFSRFLVSEEDVRNFKTTLLAIPSAREQVVSVE